MADVESGNKGVCKKEQSTTEDKQKPSAPITSKIRAYAGVISFLKYFGGGFLIWTVGRWEFNYGWILSSIAIYTLYKCYKKDKKLGVRTTTWNNWSERHKPNKRSAKLGEYWAWLYSS